MELEIMTSTGAVRVHYTLAGEGDLLILLHGWGQNTAMMQFIADHFARRFQVLNLDLPGFGQSDPPPCAWSVHEYAQFLYAFKEQLHLGDPILIAHSFGARIALSYAHRYPLQKMVLTGAAGIRKPRTLGYYMRVAAYKVMKRMGYQVNMGSEDFQNADKVMRGVLVRSVNEDLRPLLPKIKTETLLVWGELDEATPLWMGETMEQVMPNATLVVMAGDDHFAYFHQPHRFLAILEYFL